NDRYDTGVDRGRTDRSQPVRIADDGAVEWGALHEYAEAGAHGFHRGHGMESTVDGAYQRSGAEGGEIFRRGLHRHPGGFTPGAVVPFVIGELVDERGIADARSEEHTSELQSRENLVCRLLLEKKNNRS